MAKYHIKKDGTPGVCTAQEGACPLGSTSEHFSSPEEAQRFLDTKYSGEELKAKANAFIKDLQESRRLRADNIDMEEPFTEDEFNSLKFIIDQDQKEDNDRAISIIETYTYENLGEYGQDASVRDMLNILDKAGYNVGDYTKGKADIGNLGVESTAKYIDFAKEEGRRQMVFRDAKNYLNELKDKGVLEDDFVLFKGYDLTNNNLEKFKNKMNEISFDDERIKKLNDYQSPNNASRGMHVSTALSILEGKDVDPMQEYTKNNLREENFKAISNVENSKRKLTKNVVSIASNLMDRVKDNPNFVVKPVMVDLGSQQVEHTIVHESSSGSYQMFDTNAFKTIETLPDEEIEGFSSDLADAINNKEVSINNVVNKYKKQKG